MSGAKKTDFYVVQLEKEAAQRKAARTMLAALKAVCDAEREAVGIVNKQGAAFPGGLAMACEKARQAIAQAAAAGIE